MVMTTSSYTSRIGFVVGVSFGARTSIAVIERVARIENDERMPPIHNVPAVAQFAADDSIGKQIDDLVRIMEALPNAPCSPMLLADLTTVGRPVGVDMKKAGLRPLTCLVHDGATENKSADFKFSIPALNLASALSSILDAGRLRIAQDLPAASALAAELANARDGAVDGLARAVALPIWWLERKAPLPQIDNPIYRSNHRPGFIAGRT